MSSTWGRASTRTPGASWRDRGCDDDRSAGGSGDVGVSFDGSGGSGGYRGRGGMKSSARGARTAPAPSAKRTQASKRHDVTDVTSDISALYIASALVGTCAQMCPRAEVLERTRTMEISHFERPPPGASSSLKDVFSLAVKKYRRAAAGQVELDRTELRPPHVLLYTLQHLFTNVLLWPGCGFDWPGGPPNDSSSSSLVVTGREQMDFLALYHFISDRVRSVRKDFTIQRIEDDSAVQALETVVRFHLLASFRARALLQPKHAGDWSETLNDQQLVSALAQLQVLYQKDNSTSQGRLDASLEPEKSLGPSKNQSEFVAYDILLHVDDPRTVSFLLVKVPQHTRRSAQVKRALALFVALQTQDFHAFSANFQLSRPLEKSLLLKHLPQMWTLGVQMLNKAFGKQDQFRIDEFAQWLGLSGVDAARMLCDAMNLCTEAPVPEAPSQASDNWEDADIQVPAAPVVRQSAGVIRFKVSPLNAEIDKVTIERLLLESAQRIHSEEICERQSASDLVLNKLTKLTYDT